MNPISFETFGFILILAYVLMCTIFLLCQKQGKSFVDSFDKAFLWGSSLFAIIYSVDTISFFTMI